MRTGPSTQDIPLRSSEDTLIARQGILPVVCRLQGLLGKHIPKMHISKNLLIVFCSGYPKESTGSAFSSCQMTHYTNAKQPTRERILLNPRPSSPPGRLNRPYTCMNEPSKSFSQIHSPPMEEIDDCAKMRSVTEKVSCISHSQYRKSVTHLLEL